MNPSDPARKLMSEPVIALDGRTPLRAAAEVFRDERIGAAPVVTGGRVTGILSERDLLTAVADGADLDTVWVADVMTETPVVAAPDDSLLEVAERMADAGVRHMPVVDGERVLGMISVRELLDTLVEASERGAGE